MPGNSVESSADQTTVKVGPVPAVTFVPASSIVANADTWTPKSENRALLTSVDGTVVTSEQAAILREGKVQERLGTQEWVRAGTTGCFLILLLILIVFSCFQATSWNDHWQQTKEMLQIILPALTGLLGSSLGFYFGSRDKHGDGPRIKKDRA